MDIIKCICIVFLFLVTNCYGLYEDQIGKFDWKQQYVGKLKFSHLGTGSLSKKVIVATENNVLACLGLKSGEVIWRKIFEQDVQGDIQFMDVDSRIVTISGRNPYLIRGWDIDYGYLDFEWTLTSTSIEVHDQWIVTGQSLLLINLVSNSKIDVRVFNLVTGTETPSYSIPTAWLDAEKCIVKHTNIICISESNSVYSVKFGESSDNVKVQHKSLLDLFNKEVDTSALSPVEGSLSAVSVETDSSKVLLSVVPEIGRVERTVNKDEHVLTVRVNDQELLLTLSLENKILSITTVDLSNNGIISDLTTKIQYPDNLGEIEYASVVCHQKKVTACRLLLSTSDHGISLVHLPGKFVWTLEQSLASVVSVEMLDLPVSDTDAAIEKEFDNKDSGLFAMFTRRLISQAFQLQGIFLSVLGLKQPSSAVEREGLIRDEFGLHKLIILMTSPGKLFGMDNLSGKIIWEYLLDDIEPFREDANRERLSFPLFVLRNARHLPYPPQCALLVKLKEDGNSALFVFNPITGQPINKQNPLIKLGFRVKQVSALQQNDEEFYRGIFLMDNENNIHVYPKSSLPVAHSQASNTFLYSADSSTGFIEGFSLAYSTKDKLVLTKMWGVQVGQSGGKIIAVVGKNPIEKVHSQGRVLGDRSVLYKYVNPNLVAVVTIGPHPSHKTVINLYLLDVVSGNIVFSIMHRRAKEPFHIVHSENWLIYTYFSEKNRRTELTALEMYEGKIQTNSSAFSSVELASFLPIVERQSYILPANVLALRETITEKGITSKHILVALANGGILELPWIYIDPRRPVTVSPEMREEGVIPYMPELPIPWEAIINYNQSVYNVRGLYTSPSGLESTCLVFAYGLDLFYTRVSPSKTFDLLKDDFDYFLITTVLLALTSASYITRKLSSRKALKQAWK